jgi:prepilin peptidase CpaA
MNEALRAFLLGAGAIVLASLACWQDWKTRRIRNWLTVSGLGLGLMANLALGGGRGLLSALAGAGLGLAILLPVVLLRGLGAGDWKLVGALGAWLGPQMVVQIILVSIFVAGGWALLETVCRRRVKQTMRNLWELVRGFVVFGLRPHPELTIDNPGLIRLPFGVAVAAATTISVSMAWLVR